MPSSIHCVFIVQKSSIHTDSHRVNRDITGSPVAQFDPFLCLLYKNHPSTRIPIGSTGISSGHPLCRESKLAFCHIPKEERRMRVADFTGFRFLLQPRSRHGDGDAPRATLDFPLIAQVCHSLTSSPSGRTIELQIHHSLSFNFKFPKQWVLQSWMFRGLLGCLSTYLRRTI